MSEMSRKKLLMKITSFKGVWFHIVGIACLLWFLVRVLPAPHRSQYPCQQVSRTMALSYIAYWSVVFFGLTVWIRQVKLKTAALIPAILVIFIFTGMVFAGNYFDNNNNAVAWNPITKDPIGTPVGINPGRVVWVWNPDATESELQGYWWEDVNNDQTAVEQMFSSGLQELTGELDDYTAWNSLFRYINQIRGRGDVGYQSGEKIAIKINMNNCWDSRNRYSREDNDRDASPYVVKALLRHLVDTVGVAQDDITIYDASRPIPNWFYNRVYYETYPASPLVPEFPNVRFIDDTGGAPGREKVVASNERIYFSTGLYRTLPTCVVNAEYIINMPLLKMHPINNGVTLAGKNMFGTWIEAVDEIHEYHESGQIMGNPAPQTDLLAHEHIGGKTLLYIGDGTYGTLEDHETIGKFQRYPFNDDWANSLFFSQDPVALDSVMYDFLHAEGTNPIEGSQNYLHQAAEPPSDVYDPENDGIYLSESLGVHEHWDTSVNIFSSERYSGPDENGIDFVVLGEEYASPAIRIVTPKENYLYIAGREIAPLPMTVIIGKIEIRAEVSGISKETEKVEFYIDNDLKHTDYEEPYTWYWDETSFLTHTIKVVAYYNTGNTVSNEMTVWKFF